jgi:hypothetical protein
MTGLVDQREGWLGKVSLAVFKRSLFTLCRPPVCAGNLALSSVTDLESYYFMVTFALRDWEQLLGMETEVLIVQK